ncbi:HflC protein, partial [hydrothermal vent metagenome]
YFDKRILQWDGDPNQIPTREKRYIWVDTTARWRISDALKFMQSVRTEASAQARLDDIIDAATRDAISSSNLVEAIRNSNRLIKLQESEENLKKDMSLRETNLEKIEVGREKLMKDIFTQASKGVGSYGIELVDVKIKRINYVEDVQRKVYDRMISERKRAAEKFRSEGQGKKAEIEGQMSKELQQIRAQAYKRAEEIKGVADAKAIKIYADAYNRDPDFYAFIKTFESYKRTVRDDTTMMLTTDNEFYEYLGGIKLKKKLLP